MTVIK